jgi:hypothetical protein
MTARWHLHLNNEALRHFVMEALVVLLGLRSNAAIMKSILRELGMILGRVEGRTYQKS